MTTATATKRKTTCNVLATLEKLEAASREAADKATALGRQLFEKRTMLEGNVAAGRPGLLDARRRLLHRDPSQYLPDGSPRARDSDAGEIQAEIDSLGDVGALAQEVDHAGGLEKRAKADVAAHIAANYDELVEAFRPEAEAATAQVREKAAELSEALDVYLAAYGRSVGLTEPIRVSVARVFPASTRLPTCNGRSPTSACRCPRPVGSGWHERARGNNRGLRPPRPHDGRG